MARSTKASSATSPEEEETTETTEEEATEDTPEEGTPAEGDEAAAPDTAQADFSTSGAPIAEVDVADIGTDHLEGESDPIIYAGEAWVKLGDVEGVPEWAVGNIAQVISAPVVTKVDEETGASTSFNPELATYEVRERSQGITLFLPREAFDEIHTHGRPLTFA